MTCFNVRAESGPRKIEQSPGGKFHRPPLPPPSALFSDPGLPTGAKLIARTLVAQWAWSKAECWPGTPAIVRETGLSRGHVQRCLAALEARGWIRRESRGRRRVIILAWRLDAPAGAPTGDASARQGGGAPAHHRNVVVVNGQPERLGKPESDSRPRPRGPEKPAEPSAPLQVESPAPPANFAPPGILGPLETGRLDSLSPAAKERVLTWLATGDKVLIAEARKLLSPPREARPAPTSTPELLSRIREAPEFVAQAAEMLARDLGDRKSWAGLHARCRDAWEGRLAPEALADAYRQATGPKARNPGAIFMVALRAGRGGP